MWAEATPPPFSSPDSKAYRAIADTAREIFGEETPVIPFVLVGGTDSKHFLPIAGQAIRFSPIFIGEKQGGVHGVNEYITVDSLRTAAQFYEGPLRKADLTPRGKRKDGFS